MNIIIPILATVHGVVTLIIGLVPNPQAEIPKPGEFWPNFIGIKLFKGVLSPANEKTAVMIASIVIGLLLIIGGFSLWQGQAIGNTLVSLGAVSSLGFLLIYFDPIMIIGILNDLVLIGYVYFTTRT